MTTVLASLKREKSTAISTTLALENPRTKIAFNTKAFQHLVHMISDNVEAKASLLTLMSVLVLKPTYAAKYLPAVIAFLSSYIQNAQSTGSQKPADINARIQSALSKLDPQSLLRFAQLAERKKPPPNAIAQLFKGATPDNTKTAMQRLGELGESGLARLSSAQQNLALTQYSKLLPAIADTANLTMSTSGPEKSGNLRKVVPFTKVTTQRRESGCQMSALATTVDLNLNVATRAFFIMLNLPMPTRTDVLISAANTNQGGTATIKVQDFSRGIPKIVTNPFAVQIQESLKGEQQRIYTATCDGVRAKYVPSDTGLEKKPHLPPTEGHVFIVKGNAVKVITRPASILNSIK
jgi:hypothetical protein